MATKLSIDDFKPFSITCEVRYRNAFLVFDRTGLIIRDLGGTFNNIATSNISPQQSAFTSDEASIGIELGASRLTTVNPDRNVESFAKRSAIFFDSVCRHCGIEIFTRIGLRYIVRKLFDTEEESKAALAGANLANLKPTRRFNSSESPTEVLFRWEDSQVGAFFRIKAETSIQKLTVPPEMHDFVQPVDKKLEGLTIDVDYYTVAPVEREQWNPEEWLVDRIRIIRRETDSILQGGGRQ